MKIYEILNVAQLNNYLVSIEFNLLTWAGRKSVYGSPLDTNLINFAQFHQDTEWNVTIRNNKVMVVTNPEF